MTRYGIALLLVVAVVATVAALAGCGGGSSPVVVYDPAFLTPGSTPTPPSTIVGVVIFASGQHSVELKSVAGGLDEFVSRYVPTGGIERNPIPVQEEPVKAFAAFYDVATKLYVIVSIEGNKAYLYRLKTANAFSVETLATGSYKYIAVYKDTGKFYAALSVDGVNIDRKIEIPVGIVID